MMLRRKFSAATSARITVAIVLSLVLGVIAAFPIPPPVASAQAGGEIAKVCNVDFLFATSLRAADASDVTACESGYKGSGSGKTIAASCNSFSNEKNKFFCELGFKQQQNQEAAGVALTDSQLNDKAQEECDKISGNADQKAACRNGFREGYKGDKSSEDACGSGRPTPYSPAEKAACEKSYEAGQKLKVEKGGVAVPTDAADSNPDCDVSNNPLSWIICPIIDLGANFTDAVFTTFVRPLLEDIPVGTDPSDGGYKAWQGFRALGNIVLVGCLLAIVYAQARGDK